MTAVTFNIQKLYKLIMHVYIHRIISYLPVKVVCILEITNYGISPSINEQWISS